MNDVLRAIAERSSIRSYTDEKLTESEVRTLITAGLQAPTARNLQEIHISVVDGNNPILAEIERERRLDIIEADVEESAKEAVRNNPNNFYYNASIVFMLSADRNFYWSMLDAGIAAENISLAAHSLGLGSLIIGIIKDTMLGEKKEYFAEALEFPENYEFAICVAAGHKNVEKIPHAFDFDRSVSFIL